MSLTGTNHETAAAPTSDQEEERKSRSPRSGAKSAIEDHVASLLEAEGAPLHITDIRNTLIERGVPLPGRGDEANIIVRLRRATDRFVRTGRGTYGSVSWGLEEVSPTRTRRRSKNRKGGSK
jgi:hypothetical protein